MTTCFDCKPRAGEWLDGVTLCPLHAAAQDMRATLGRLHDIAHHVAEEHCPAEDEPAFAAHAAELNAALDEARALLQSLPGALPSGVATAAAETTVED